MSQKRSKLEPIEILLVEDSEADVELVTEAFEEAKIPNNMHVAADGVAALDFLRKQGQYSDAPTPDLVLLDLNMPRMNGHEALEEIKKDEALKHIPVMVLTTSDDSRDILYSYQRFASCYITKPVDFDEFIDMVKAIEKFWFSIVRFPQK